MLTITDAQMAALEKERRDKLIAKIDGWLLDEDKAWPAAKPAQRVEIIDGLLTYAEQSGMSCERDYAVFCRAAILLRAEWRAFIEAPAQRELLLAEGVNGGRKLRTFYHRAEAAAQAQRGVAS